jgi:hypothetical protein
MATDIVGVVAGETVTLAGDACFDAAGRSHLEALLGA